MRVITTYAAPHPEPSPAKGEGRNPLYCRKTSLSDQDSVSKFVLFVRR